MDEIAALRANAEKGNPQAQFRFARALLLGPAAPGVVEEASKWLDASAAQGLPTALMQQAALACIGWGRPQDFPAALSLLEQAAATGDASAVGQLKTLGGSGKVDLAVWFAPGASVQHCDAPRIYTVKGLVPAPACAWLINRPSDQLQRAPVKDAKRGGPAFDEARTNTGFSFSPIERDLVVQLVNLRIAAAVGLPLANQERTNILHYDIGQEYRPHFDFIKPDEEQGFGFELETIGQRVATVLVYLNDDYDGGETAFPRLQDWKYKGGVGDALVFWNLSESGERERNSLHSGLPVTKGVKWLLSKWIRQKPVPVS